MNSLGIALIQADFCVGALIPNANKIAREAAAAREAGAAIVVFPELALSGHPLEGLLLKPRFLKGCEAQLQRLARQLPPDVVTVVGAPRWIGGQRHNAAVVFYEGREVGASGRPMFSCRAAFDEHGTYAPDHRWLVINIGERRLAIHLGEDIPDLERPPGDALRRLALDGLIHLSASPFHRGKRAQREERLARLAHALHVTVFFVNLVGGQDEYVFDGSSVVIAPDGTPIARAKAFAVDRLLVPLPTAREAGAEPQAAADEIRLPALREAALPVPRVEPALSDVEEIYRALQLGLRDYVDKNGFDKVVLGLSGGIDSAFVAVLAVDTLGAERVKAVVMPSPYSSAETMQDARQLAEKLRIELIHLPIHRLFATYREELAPVFASRPPDVTEENLQARIRATLLMALSNKFGWLVLTTGNKSELATGYCTLYGDMAGGFAVIKDVPKTLVYELARWRNAREDGPVIPESILARPPSAELRPNQKDTDTLPPYEVLDAILERYIERDESYDDIVAAGFDPATVRRVLRMVDRSEYKRRQGPPGIQVTRRALGRDWRVPITCFYEESGADSR